MENKDRLQAYAADETALCIFQGDPEHLKQEGLLPQVSDPLKFTSEQKNICCRRYGTRDTITQILKTQIRTLEGT